MTDDIEKINAKARQIVGLPPVSGEPSLEHVYCSQCRRFVPIPAGAMAFTEDRLASLLTDVGWWKHANPDSDKGWSSGELARAILNATKEQTP